MNDGIELKIKELEIMFDAFEAENYAPEYLLDAKDKYVVHYLDKDLLELQKDYLTRYPDSVVMYQQDSEEKRDILFRRLIWEQKNRKELYK